MFLFCELRKVVALGAFARMGATQCCRRHWTTHVGPGQIVTRSIKTGLVSNPTPSGLIATMQSTAISKRRDKAKGPVSLQEQPLLLQMTPVSNPQPLFSIFFLAAYISWTIIAIKEWRKKMGNQLVNQAFFVLFCFNFFGSRSWWAGTSGCMYPSSARYVLSSSSLSTLPFFPYSNSNTIMCVFYFYFAFFMKALTWLSGFFSPPSMLIVVGSGDFYFCFL